MFSTRTKRQPRLLNNQNTPLKHAIVTVLVLALSDFSLHFTIETDASRVGLGAVLSQYAKPIAYYSQKPSPRAQMKSIYRRKLMAIATAVQNW
ncbi:hypothetical protein E6C27_scaffold81G00260 [Cucumis melo var. makuwa]|uniref:Reverse transcriptase/retrotransposon-derived protein RNase H-like domain-containing protein n=1 Tax=Cucumis melo var. makuwa TaxID=1194695 RepID=A0A5A7SR11_CUCMM|nr:hypothetical protein E6C27_scaffold81G00260 [Cucumis melo var. makuwa]